MYKARKKKWKTTLLLGSVLVLFESVLQEFVIKQDVQKLYKEILKETFNGEVKSRKLRTRQINMELDKLSKRIESVEEKFFDDVIDVSTYNSG